jgi:hypothetical protein
MTAVAVSSGARALPGVRFEAQPPPSPVVLPRMDVAAFAGFACGGPFDAPVAVEDPAQFAEVFGADLELALDADGGEPARAQLGPAVRAFLRNGGRRCWAIRVGDAERAVTSRFPVPGLLCRQADRTLRPVALEARSPGTWADDVTVGAALASAPAAVVADWGDGLLDVRFAGGGALVAGHLLRCSGDGWSVMAPAGPAPADALDARGDPLPALAPGAVRLALDLGRVVWSEPVGPDEPARARAAVRLMWTGSDGVWGASGRGRVRALDEDGRLRVELDVPAADAPAPGTLVAVAGAGERELWLAVEELRAAAPDGGAGSGGGAGGGAGAGSGGAGGGGGARVPPVELVGPAWWTAAGLPLGLPRLAAGSLVERLTLELSVVRPGAAPARLAGLAFAPEHPRWVGTLPSDAERHAPPLGDRPHTTPPSLWHEAQGFPLAGVGAPADGLLVPLALGVAPGRFLGAAASATPPLERDGIVLDAPAGDVPQLDPALFLDPALVDVGARELADAADAIRFRATRPRALRGLHAALALDEVTLLAVPDAVQRPWREEPAPPLPEVTADRRRPHPDPAHFHACGARVLEAPVLRTSEPDEGGRAELVWTAVDAGDGETQYVVEGSNDPTAFAGAQVLYDGPETHLNVDARRSGPFYRVRAYAGAAESDWSNGVAIDAGPPVRATLVPADRFRPDALLDVQRAALRVGAARGDVLAVLSLPRHYDERAAIAHADELRASTEDTALAHGALYHPWTIVRAEQGAALRTLPPDGPATGVLARRARTRGAWVAPAGEPLADTVALVPALAEQSRLALEDAHVNAFVQRPAGFLALSEDTLADGDARPIGVRRLLDLLRRLIELHGPAYAFEPHDARLRRRVQRTFGTLMRELHGRGAFSGATAAEAFQVRTGEPPNTRQDAEQGRLLVELRVAPSRPLRFLTVRLVAGAAGGVEVQEA